MSSGRNKTILLVEDDRMIAEVETIQLEEYGYRIICAYSGEEAVTISEERSDIDLILMDISLDSGIDGIQAARIILEKKDIPIIFLSTHTDPDIVKRTEEVTSYGYVVKGSGVSVLNISIKIALKLFGANRKVKENEKLLSSIAENYPNSYLSIIKADYSVGFTSGQQFKKQNLDPKQFIGMTPEQVFGSQADIVEAYYKKTFNGEECSFELYINNQYQFFRTVPLYGEDGTISRILSVSENITGRKYAVGLVQERSKQLDLLFTHSLDGIALLDKKYTCIRVSKTYADYFKKDPAYFSGRSHFDLYPAVLQADFEEIKKTKKVCHRSQCTYTFPGHPELQKLCWDISLVPILNKKDEIEYFLLTLKEVEPC